MIYPDPRWRTPSWASCRRPGPPRKWEVTPQRLVMPLLERRPRRRLRSEQKDDTK